jgi:hypothetical protein
VLVKIRKRRGRGGVVKARAARCERRVDCESASFQILTGILPCVKVSQSLRQCRLLRIGLKRS